MVRDQRGYTLVGLGEKDPCNSGDSTRETVYTSVSQHNITATAVGRSQWHQVND